jgi:LemA protein
LISVCEQFAQYERRTLDHVISARQHYLSAGSRDQKIKADQEMSQVLRGVFAIGEAYPNLKSSDQFVQIQTTIANLENQLADRRELYNDSVTNFNTRILQFPDLLLAGRLGYNSESLYSVPEEDKKVPQLKLTLP